MVLVLVQDTDYQERILPTGEHELLYNMKLANRDYEKALNGIRRFTKSKAERIRGSAEVSSASEISRIYGSTEREPAHRLLPSLTVDDFVRSYLHIDVPM